MQADAAASVAGDDRLVLVVGPAGAGKTRMLTAAADDLHRHGRVVFGAAPTARAARTLQRDTGIRSDTVAKLLHEWQRTDPLPEYRLGAGTTLVVDEAGMLTTPALHQLVALADANRWRLALIGDFRQLQGVGRGGLLEELCTNGRVDELEHLHRFTHRWEATASLLLRSGDPHAFDAYEAHGRIIAGTRDTHRDRMAQAWLEHHEHGDSIALVASSNDHVDTINQAVQVARLASGQLSGVGVIAIGGGELACVGDVVATRRNDRRLVTSTGEPVRNRDTWTVTGIATDGSVTVSHRGGHGAVTLPADYVAEHVRLGYAATEHGYQSDTVTTAIALTSAATSRRGLYVAATRGRDENVICVISDSRDLAEARDILDSIVAVDRADIPAVTQRRTLAQQQRGHDIPTSAPLASRCVIPDWFAPLLRDARHDLAAAEHHHVARAIERQRLHDAAVAANRALYDVAAATASDRDTYVHAAARADTARRDHAAAEHQLAIAPRRHRRTARHNIEIAEQRRERADAYLERTRQRTEPAVERYRQVHAQRRDAHDTLRYRDTADLLDAMQHPVDDHRRRVAALETWQRWATGARVQVDDLRESVETLDSAAGRDSAFTKALAGNLRQWAHHHRVDLGASTEPELAIRRPALELEL
jgi:hypothetical protein